jgi:hypothetical protein
MRLACERVHEQCGFAFLAKITRFAYLVVLVFAHSDHLDLVNFLEFLFNFLWLLNPSQELVNFSLV